MKKLLILFAAIMFAATASFATNPPIVNVTWFIDDECDCTTTVYDYYKVTISIYDNANSTWIYSNYTRTANTSAENLYFEVEDMLDYCHDSHPNPPSFTVTATVWYMLGTPDPDEECCTASEVDTGICDEFEGDDIFVIPVGELN